MLHIVLVILKIIGIVLLAVLGLLLALLLLILLIPVRYRMKGSYYGELKGHVKVTWLLHIISFRAAYDGHETEFAIRLFGLQLFKQKDEVAPKEAAQELEQEMMESEELLQIQELPKVPPPPAGETKQRISSEPVSTENTKKQGKHKEKTKKRNPVIAFFQRIKLRVKAYIDQLKSWKLSLEKARDFIENEDNRRTFLLVLRQARRLIKHVLPQRVRGKITFGLDDPYYTGQVLTFASILYPLYHKSLKLTPVFDLAMLDGEIDLKGRVRIATVLVLMIRVYFDKNFRVLLKRWR